MLAKLNEVGSNMPLMTLLSVRSNKTIRAKDCGRIQSYRGIRFRNLIDITINLLESH